MNELSQNEHVEMSQNTRPRTPLHRVTGSPAGGRFVIDTSRHLGGALRGDGAARYETFDGAEEVRPLFSALPPAPMVSADLP